MRAGDWISRFRDVTVANHTTPFGWGAFDCCLAPSLVTQAVAGIDIAQPFRGYKTRRGALGKLKRYVKGDVVGRELSNLLEVAAVQRADDLGLVEVQPLRAQRADVVLASAETDAGPNESVLAIVDLSGTALITASQSGGWARLPLSAGRRAWKIG